MILHKLTKKEFYTLAKLVLAELDEAQIYFDNAMTRSMYENTKYKYKLCDMEIEYLRLFRSWPFVLRCADGKVLRVTTPLVKNKYRYNYNENGECVGFVDTVNEKRNRDRGANEKKVQKVLPKSSLNLDEQVKIMKSFNKKHNDKVPKKHIPLRENV